MSLSVRRAWIEIGPRLAGASRRTWSLSVRRAWIEIALRPVHRRRKRSLSVRRAWIEILKRQEDKQLTLVALREESVD